MKMKTEARILANGSVLSRGRMVESSVLTWRKGSVHWYISLTTAKSGQASVDSPWQKSSRLQVRSFFRAFFFLLKNSFESRLLPMHFFFIFRTKNIPVRRPETDTTRRS